jgi:DNA-binding NarL/FixJ family response regulator
MDNKENESKGRFNNGNPKGLYSMEKIKLLMGSNHELWWDGLFCLLGKVQDFQVFPICYNIEDTINQARQIKPNIILLDEEIEGRDCSELALGIYDINPEIKIIIITKPYKNINLSSSFKARAKAYIDKDITFSELESCIRQVNKGGVVIISPMVAHKLLEQIANLTELKNNDVINNLGLSKREMDVLTILTRKPATNKEIAEALYITENTVKAHMSTILEKMQVRSRQEAAKYAREKGILSQIKDK